MGPGIWNGEKLKKQSGGNSLSEWQARPMRLYPGGDGEPLKVSELSRDLNTVRREVITMVKGRGGKAPD